MKDTLLKVTHVIGSLHHGGAEVLLTDLLPRLKARGVDIELVALSGTNPLAGRLALHGVGISTMAHPGGTIYRLDRWAPTAWRLYRCLKEKVPAVVHSHVYMADVMTRLVTPRGTRLVTTLHIAEPWWEQPERLRSRMKTHIERILAAWREVRLIAVSRDTAESSLSAFRVKSQRLRVIYNGIAVDRFRVNEQRWTRKEFSAPIVVQVGRMYPQKGHSVALQAFPGIVKEFPKASLLFVGDGPLRRQLEVQAERLNLDGHVRFLGVRDDMPDLLDQSDLFWMPSHFEGLGIACLEAMASGLPTVTTAVAGLREVPVDGVTGFVVPPNSPQALTQASLRILKDPTLARLMGIAGRRRVAQHFSIEKTADEYLWAYEDILKGQW